MLLPVIMAVGSRCPPLSLSPGTFPKQIFPPVGDDSLFPETHSPPLRPGSQRPIALLHAHAPLPAA